TFAWSTNENGTTITVCPLVTTDYFVTVTDANGCTDVDVITVTVAPSPAVDAGPDVTLCEGLSTTLLVSASGGTPPYTYAWDNGLGAGDSHTVTPAHTTTYTVTVTDANGCTATDMVTVTVDPIPTVDAGLDNDICAGETVQLNGSIGGGATSATWGTSGDGSFNNPNLLNAIYTPGPNDI
ncbi:MAG: hypothetical protein KDD09_27175, partial [Phaeodactylibacter sp.]|nr:hypothetical protein [Phaeodactylibacter sp.]